MKYTRYRHTLILIFGLIILNPSVALYGQEIKLATGDHYFPYADTRVLGNGWSHAIVLAAFDEMGTNKIQIDTLPWARATEWTKDGRYVAAFPYVYTKQRAKEFLFSDPINWVPMHFYTTKDYVFNELSDLTNKRFCVPHGYEISEKGLDIIRPLNLQIIRGNSTKACLKHVERKYVDIGFINGHFGSNILKIFYEQNDVFQVVPITVDSVPLHLMFSRSVDTSKTMLQQFNSALKTIRNNGVKTDIDKRYLDWLKQQ